MELECFATSSELDVNTVQSVTSYQEFLIVHITGKGTRKNRLAQEIRLYKTQQQSLVIHSQINAGEISSWFVESEEEPPKLFAFYSLDLQKPIVVILMRFYMSAHDFDGTLLAEERPHSYSFGNGDRKYRFLVWRQHYLIDADHGILQLIPAKASDFPSYEAPKPYKFQWSKHDLNGPRQIFHLDQHLMTTTRIMMGTPHLEIKFYTWDEHSEPPGFVPSKFQLLATDDKPEIFEYTDLVSIHYLPNNIVGIVRPTSYWKSDEDNKKQAVVWSLEGKYERKFKLGNGTVFIWNNLILHIAAERPRVNAVTLWNCQGQLVDEYQMDIPAFYVWNRNLVVFNDLIEVYRGDCLTFTFLISAVSMWPIERLLWLAFMKNRNMCPLGTLPKEILRMVISLLRVNNAVPVAKSTSKNGTKRKAQEQRKSKRSKKK